MWGNGHMVASASGTVINANNKVTIKDSITKLFIPTSTNTILTKHILSTDTSTNTILTDDALSDEPISTETEHDSSYVAMSDSTLIDIEPGNKDFLLIQCIVIKIPFIDDQCQSIPIKIQALIGIGINNAILICIDGN